MTGSYRTYYVNQKTGRDSNDGLTMDSPFASLFQVNRLRLYPGDKVLLARDSVFTDQFLQKTVEPGSIPLKLALIHRKKRRREKSP